MKYLGLLLIPSTLNQNSLGRRCHHLLELLFILTTNVKLDALKIIKNSD